MVVRFDSKAVQQNVANQAEPIGVEGDPATKSGGLTEAEAIVLESKKKLDQSGAPLEQVSTEQIIQEQEHHAEPGPELNPEALEKARKDTGSAPTDGQSSGS